MTEERRPDRKPRDKPISAQKWGPHYTSEPTTAFPHSPAYSGTPQPQQQRQHQQQHTQLRRLPGARLWAWVVAGLILLAGLVAVFQVFVTTATGQMLEHAALEAAPIAAGQWHTPTMRILGVLPQVVGVVAALGFLVLTVWRRRWWASLIAVLMFGAANLTTQVLKNLVLTRPHLDNGVPYYTGNSLPSGHTTFAAAAVVAVFLVVAPRWRPAIAALGAVFATAVGVATLLEAWHRPADMVAAYLVAALWGLVGGFVIFRTGTNWNTLSSRTTRYPWPSGHPGWDVLLWLVGLGMLGGAWFAVTLAGGLETLPAVVDATYVPSRWYLMYGTMFAAGGGFVVFAFLSSFFRWEAGRKHSRAGTTTATL